MMQTTISQCLELMKKHGEDVMFTLEPMRGETYNEEERCALYAHYPYEESSVLAGQNCRRFLDCCDRSFADQMIEGLEENSIEVEFLRHSTHIPVDVITRHLPGPGFDEDW